VIRTIDGFHPDDAGDWVAELSCLHSQHVRHRPPFWDRPWVVTEEGRRDRIGSATDCPLCDRSELPADVVVARTAGPFDEATLPAALRRAHRVAERTWGRLRILEGVVGFSMDTEPPTAGELQAGDAQPIPPGVDHTVDVRGPVVVEIDFLVRPGSSGDR
jgi:tellurite methyltransferase